MMAENIYNLLNRWKNNTYLANFTLEYDSDVYCKALSVFSADYARWFPDADMDDKKLSLIPQLQVLLCYRIANTIFKMEREESADIYSLLGRTIGQMEIYYSSEIGPGLKINHGIGTVIGGRVKIGNNCMIHQNCTLGDRLGGRPDIGDNVTIYAGAMVLGNIKIGSDSIIGANSVVIHDFPPMSVLIGSPANNIKILK